MLTLTSPAFEHGGVMPVTYTIDGHNISPPLLIGGVSDQAKSLALIVEDPDAATDPHGPGKTFDHWVVFNISPETMQIAEGATPNGAIVGRNGAGDAAYFGPAPPTGEHRYYFWLYELRDTLELDDRVSKAQVLAALKPIVIASAELMGTYQRPAHVAPN